MRFKTVCAIAAMNWKLDSSIHMHVGDYFYVNGDGYSPISVDRLEKDTSYLYRVRQFARDSTGTNNFLCMMVEYEYDIFHLRRPIVHYAYIMNDESIINKHEYDTRLSFRFNIKKRVKYIMKMLMGYHIIQTDYHVH